MPVLDGVVSACDGYDFELLDLVHFLAFPLSACSDMTTVAYPLAYGNTR
jgi:hypothetical protein